MTIKSVRMAWALQEPTFQKWQAEIFASHNPEMLETIAAIAAEGVRVIEVVCELTGYCYKAVLMVAVAYDCYNSLTGRHIHLTEAKGQEMLKDAAYARQRIANGSDFGELEPVA